jgi:hypothetical protein
LFGASAKALTKVVTSFWDRLNKGHLQETPRSISRRQSGFCLEHRPGMNLIHNQSHCGREMNLYRSFRILGQVIEFASDNDGKAVNALLGQNILAFPSGNPDAGKHQ